MDSFGLNRLKDKNEDKSKDNCRCTSINSYRAMLRLLAEVEEYEVASLLFIMPWNYTADKDELGVMVHINCNDYFAYACADGVEVPIADAEKLLDIYHEYGYQGIYAYACIKRGMWPIKEECDEEFRDITKEVAKRFFRIEELVLKPNFYERSSNEGNGQ